MKIKSYDRFYDQLFLGPVRQYCTKTGTAASMLLTWEAIGITAAAWSI